MRREEKLLLCLSKTSPPLFEDEFNFLTKHPFNWNLFSSLALKHKVAPLVYNNTVTFKLPEKTRQELKGMYILAGLKNDCFRKELASIFRRLNREGIDAVVLKGVGLVETAYKNRSLKYSEDIDLLVRQGDLEKVDVILGALGYQLLPARSRDHHFQYLNPEKHVALELHWNFFTPREGLAIDLEEFWRHTQPIKVDGAAIKCFGGEYQLLHLCLHATASRFLCYSLSSFVDIFEFIKSNKVDWQKTSLLSRRMGGDYFVYFSLCLTNHFFGGVLREALECFELAAWQCSFYSFMAQHFFLYDKLPEKMAGALHRFIIKPLSLASPI